MTNQALQYYLHDEPDAFRLELSGSLSGEGARSVYQAWSRALSIIGLRTMIVDITYLAEIDERGRNLLRLWRRRQARIVAASPESRALAESVLGEPYPVPPARTNIFQRVTAFVRGFVATAGFPAAAEGQQSISALALPQGADSTAPENNGHLEYRVPYTAMQVGVPRDFKGARKCFDRG
jgi:hypothetical protein